MRVWPPTSTTSSMSEAVTLASASAFSTGGRVRWMSSSVNCSSLDRVSVICRWIGPAAFALMNGRLISVDWVDDSSILAFSAASRMRWRATRSEPELDALILLELGDQPIHDRAVEIVAAEEGVAVGGHDLDDALTDAQHRDVERAATQVVNGDLLVAPDLVEAIRERRRRRLVDDPQDSRRRSARRPWSPGAGRR
jgi:hypothetical protein